METIAASTGNAKVTDYRKGSSTYGKEVNVTYDIPAFDVVSTADEMHAEFSEKQLIAMAQSRQKATANSAARQKAIAGYAPTGDDLAKENIIKSVMALKPELTREQAEAHVAALGL